MEFLKKILVPLVVMALGAVDVSAMERDELSQERESSQRRFAISLRRKTVPPHLQPQQSVTEEQREVVQDKPETPPQEQLQVQLPIQQPSAPQDDTLNSTGAEVWHLVSSCGKYIWSIMPISGGAQYVWSKVPNTLPYGLPQGLVEAGLTVMLPSFLDQALGICYMDTTPCPHEGIHWKLLAGWSVVGICSAVHLTKYLLG